LQVDRRIDHATGLVSELVNEIIDFRCPVVDFAQEAHSGRIAIRHVGEKERRVLGLVPVHDEIPVAKVAKLEITIEQGLSQGLRVDENEDDSKTAAESHTFHGTSPP
jgi:hypothetical protein